MRTQVIEKVLYKFDELSDQAKEKAIEDHREFTSQGMPWQGENKDTLHKFADIFPIKAKDWEYGGNSDHIFWEFTGDENVENLKGQRLATYLWNNYRGDLLKGKYYSTNGTYDEKGKYHYKFRHSKITLEHSCVLTGYCMDDTILDDVYKFMDKPDNRTFYDLMHDCLHNWLFGCRDDYEYQLSDESIIENIQANEYEFDEDGNLD